MRVKDEVTVTDKYTHTEFLFWISCASVIYVLRFIVLYHITLTIKVPICQTNKVDRLGYKRLKTFTIIDLFLPSSRTPHPA